VTFSAFIGSAAQSTFDPQQNSWTLTNGWISAQFALSPAGIFSVGWLADQQSGDVWMPRWGQITTPIRLQLGGDVYDESRQYTLFDHYTQSLPNGIRQMIVLQDTNGASLITLVLDLYDNQPVLRYHARFRNLGSNTVYAKSADMLSWNFADLGRRFTALHVNQWSIEGLPADFEQLQTVLDTNGTSVDVYSGAHQQHCGWLAVRDTDQRGLFFGWEFDGRAKTTIRHEGANGRLSLSSSVLNLNHAVAPGADFSVPTAFIGTFHGDFDEAGYRTQRFVESTIAKQPPDPGAFPYVAWDSWAYEDQIDEATLRRNAEIAAAIGVELFLVDLGWARNVGDWYADPTKFPSGLGALADYVHSLGMKFGLHFALTEADPKSPVLRSNPDWTSSENDDYHGALSLCLSNQPARDWLIQQGIRMIDDYHVDWILQDGENMVKECTKSSHTHDPQDSNYANSVEGLNAVVSGIQAARPNVLWENCEDGGNMMTFNMVRNYVTSITNDASGSLGSRRAAYGVTFPFSPRYAERYMPDSDGVNDYATHSYRFGGNWALMTRLADLTPDQLGFLKREIVSYKAQRTEISGGKVFHIQPPAPNVTDVIQSYNPGTDNAIAVITRAAADSPLFTYHPKGLNPGQRYTVWFEIDPSVYSLSGSQLMDNGIRVQLPLPFSSEIVHIDHQQ
jgi:alpha-galactosidase